MSKKIIESQIRGLKCDNPNCDWVDMSISVEDYHKYVGAKCPKCGEIVLTEADFKAIKPLYNSRINITFIGIDILGQFFVLEMQQI